MAEPRPGNRLRSPLLVFAVLAAVSVPANPFVAPAAYAEASLVQVTGFGSNPGNLTMYSYRPTGAPAGRPLVVLLHGCTQSAADYFTHSGWRKYADLWGLVLVLPEQKTTNNGNVCFNWFEPADTTRGGGEALSIRQMVDHAVSAYGADSRRVFITGLSAGGAMTAVMLAAYPDVFAAGAVIGGLAYRCATDVASAFGCMGSPPNRTPGQWGDLVRGAHPGYRGPYPRVAIWYGTSDTTVVPANADELRDQWTDVWGVAGSPSSSTSLRGNTVRYDYADATGAPAVRVYRVAGIGHGTPVDPGPALDECGTTARFYLDSICSTYHAAVTWGLSPSVEPPPDPPGPIGCVTADNYQHTVAQRAYVRGGWTYAVGSDDAMGLWSTFIVHSLRPDGPGRWVVADGEC
jgi:poly(hydroxyalkanoate) depolymerase family esterase